MAAEAAECLQRLFKPWRIRLQASDGKTTLYHTVSQYYHSKNQPVICVASSGIAALLLPGGAHVAFDV
jgi:hypothetical protein